ncbi:DUF262 domain-containing protein [Flavobacterium sp. xlx-214]|uniref:DUF262 domain-containing protein n=1 Tax=unclassified Flavobacterium TaxID=196869 RepID=UPI0013D76754|nr:MULTISPECIES: DUF262 domain-containing protein [unclassified Flavobacterium]MBA5792632.1 DUF262 domain-containing protein [Flavobacterium sp. xlx-221]QMI83781.1 DUF262 domain-containing protein [Flavobacterium sp. xlx-214]
MEDNLEFDDKTEENEVIEIPQEVRKITTQAYDKSVSDIVRMIEDGDINLNPEYQRNYIWDNKKSSLLIESLILNVPIPVVYVSQEEDDSWTVIDGLQRLNSLYRFFQRDFKLSGLEILTELNKSDVKSLNPKALRVLKNGLLRIIVISHDSHPEIKYDVFMRLNTGAVKLNDQELRNCLYRGKLNEKVKEITKKENILALFSLEGPHKRMADCELILRFLSLYYNFNSDNNSINNYKGRMKNFINDFLVNNNKISEEKLNEIENLIDEVSDTIIKVYSQNAFKRFNTEDVYENTLNRSLMDILFISTAVLDRNRILEKKDEIFQKFKLLITNDTEFRNSITIGTSDTKVLNYRIDRWINEIKTIINA